MDMPLQILYVDPDEETQSIVKSTLDVDWNVDVVDSPDSADEMIKSKSYDCVVSTNDLERKSGINFYEEINKKIEDSIFILFCENASVNTIQRAYRRGVDDIVIQSYDPETDGGEAVAVNNQAQHSGGGNTQSIQKSVTILQNRIATSLLDVDTDIQETVFSSITSLLGAADDELDLKIDFALESIGEKMDVNRCMMYEYVEDENEKRYELKNEWCSSDNCDTPSAYIGDDVVSAGDFPGHENSIKNFDTLCQDLTPGSTTPVQKSVAESVSIDDIGNLLVVPLVSNWQLQSVILVTTKYARVWNESIQQQINALGEVIINTRRRKDDRKQLEEQNERLEQFTSVVSHDLQNPLSIAKGYVDLAIEAEDVGHLGEASEALHRMEEMIDELLTLAKQGDSIGETTEVEVKKVVDDAWNGIDSKDAALNTEGVESMPKQEADVSRLQEVFENLFKNAIDHVGDDVTITVREIDDGVAIGDDGDGIPENKRDQIFERGYTGGGGTGFGLAIVEEIVEAHDWKITVGESDAGGAEFRILFR